MAMSGTAVPRHPCRRSQRGRTDRASESESSALLGCPTRMRGAGSSLDHLAARSSVATDSDHHTLRPPHSHLTERSRDGIAQVLPYQPPKRGDGAVSGERRDAITLRAPQGALPPGLRHVDPPSSWSCFFAVCRRPSPRMPARARPLPTSLRRSKRPFSLEDHLVRMVLGGGAALSSEGSRGSCPGERPWPRLGQQGSAVACWRRRLVGAAHAGPPRLEACCSSGRRSGPEGAAGLMSGVGRRNEVGSPLADGAATVPTGTG